MNYRGYEVGLKLFMQPSARLTLKHAMALVRQHGFTLRNTGDDYRVNVRGGSEATAYYTDDLQDAVDTAAAMAREID